MGDELQKTGAKSVGGELLFFFLLLHPIVTRITYRDSLVWELRKVERRSDFLDVVLHLFCEPSNCFDAPGTDVLLHLREDRSCVLFHRKTFEQIGRSASKASIAVYFWVNRIEKSYFEGVWK
ncbi:hypothetical protein TNCT_126251 [Trichonephila clavata]|uniref:Uncharacterized protein n=1 Tax=Trichonephila clavata TaxID=2740835 RepID=A0A8X6M3L2_TRICU|nr:hypothetical protein TNCT_126251 [Trichonephila clavata]